MREPQILGRQKSARRNIWAADYLGAQPLLEAIRESVCYMRGQVLDIGCGHRPYEAWLPSSVTHYVGLDYEKTDTSPHLVADALHLPFPSASFDTVISLQTLEHLPDPFQAFGEIGRVLRPGGKLILTAPQSWREHEQPHDYFRFTSFGLRRLCERSGLTPLTVRAAGRAWSHLGQSFLTALSQFRLIQLIAPLRLVTPIALAVNLTCRTLDRLFSDEGEAINRLLIAEKANGS